MARILHRTLQALAALHVLIVLPFAWILRDGLGPDSVESSGLEAAGRWFGSFHAGPVLILLVVAALGVGAARNRS